jgi:hypothetical protein
MPRYRAPTSSTWPAAACSRLAAADFFTVEVLTLGGLGFLALMSTISLQTHGICAHGDIADPVLVSGKADPFVGALAKDDETAVGALISATVASLVI